MGPWIMKLPVLKYDAEEEGDEMLMEDESRNGRKQQGRNVV